MKLIVGLGNPGKEYQKTRHNIGFMAVDALADYLGGEWQSKPKWRAEICEITNHDQKVLLVKPTSFYNLTGEVVRQIGDFYKVNHSKDLLVIHDDLALDFGTIRVRHKGSDAGNNGIKSIILHIGGNFWRIRIGTNSPLAIHVDTAHFVLTKLSFAERRRLKSSLTKVTQVANNFIHGQVAETSLKP